MTPDASFVAAPARMAQASAAQAPTPNGKQGGDQGADHGESFFSELWDIINPLQHLPVIGMAYRAITGQHMDGFARVAGDALYGGLWGAGAAVADEAFEAITGKSAEDTVLAWLGLDSDSGSGSGAPVRVAANKLAPHIDPATVTAGVLAVPPISAAPASAPGGPVVNPAASPVGLVALNNALAKKGITGATAQAALYAYRQSIALTGAQPVPFAVN